MDNSTAINTAPLTRRQAREMERRTGVRPVARLGAVYDTDRIERNEMDALVSVLPTELVERIAEPVAPAAAVEEVPAAFDGRGLTVRAATPATLVAARRRRTVGGFAVAASAAALAAAGVAGTVADPGTAVASQANLVTAADTVGADAIDTNQVETAADAPAPAQITENGASSSVVSVAAADVQLAAGEEPVVVSASAGSGSGSGGGASVGGNIVIPATGSLQERFLAAAYAQVGSAPQDCTDMVQNALAAIGLTTRRDQGGYDMGISSFEAFGTIIPMSEIEPGDIIIKYGVHVAIYAGNGQAVHGGWNGDADNTVVSGLGYTYDTAVRLS